MATTIVFYVSGHGFGHASRDIEVMNAFLARRPDARVCVRTAAARWLFDLTVRGPFEFVDVEIDFGVVQVDALTPDIPATIDHALAFYDDPAPLIAREAEALRAMGADAVVADVPPLAFAAAHRAGVPSVALTNFTWEWIYDDYVRLLGRGGELVQRIRAWHELAREAWRLPMHGGFGGFRRVRDLPLVGRRSRLSRNDARARFGWDAASKVVLVSFGGVGMRPLPLEAVAASGEFVIVSTHEPAAPGRSRHQPARQLRLEPDPTGERGESAAAQTHAASQQIGREPASSRATGGGLVTNRDGVTIVAEQRLYASVLRYEDLVAAADVVVTKPGYGIIAECIANSTALLYTSRGRFAEYEVLVRDMPRWARSRFISNEDLLDGRWAHALRALLDAPGAPEEVRADGAEVAASWLEAFGHP